MPSYINNEQTGASLEELSETIRQDDLALWLQVGGKDALAFNQEPLEETPLESTEDLTDNKWEWVGPAIGACSLFRSSLL